MLFTFQKSCAIITFADREKRFGVTCKGDKMSSISLSREDGAGITVVSNLFIDHYMKDANDAQIKVYLYLLRKLSNLESFTISDIADEFNHTEKDVCRSLKYWEKQGLISLKYDGLMNIVGITLLKSEDPVSRPRFETLAPIVNMVPRVVAPASSVPAKPTYSAADIASFAQDLENSELLAVTEQYLRRPLSPSDIRSLIYIRRELNFDTDKIDSLIQNCLSQSKKDVKFSFIEQTACNWYEQGINVCKNADKKIAEYDKSVYDVMKALGKSGTPTAKELEYINKWITTYGFSGELVLEACQRTVMATDSHRFEYADGIFSNWIKGNVKTMSDVEKLDNEHKRIASVRKPSVKTNNFQNFSQRTYDNDLLEREILSN